MHELSNICCDRNPVPAQQRKAIEALLDAGADIHETDKNGVTALHHAVRFRSPTAVATLLERGANVNQVCKRSGSTPLHRAVTSTGAPGTAGRQAEARQIIDLLLLHGADPSIKNKNGKVPVYPAYETGESPTPWAERDGVPYARRIPRLQVSERDLAKQLALSARQLEEAEAEFLSTTP